MYLGNILRWSNQSFSDIRKTPLCRSIGSKFKRTSTIFFYAMWLIHHGYLFLQQCPTKTYSSTPSLFKKNYDVINFKYPLISNPHRCSMIELVHNYMTLSALMWHSYKMTPTSFPSHFRVKKVTFLMHENRIIANLGVYRSFRRADMASDWSLV